jgi:ABC-type bacteriocin/lantibiotic exporter with double-glycine peptidase domain
VSRSSFHALPFAVAFLAVLTAGGCVRYAGASQPISPDHLAGEGWQRVPDMELVRQEAEADCGAAAVAMVLARWIAPTTVADVRAKAPPIGKGFNARVLRDLLRGRGLRAFVIEGRIGDLEHEVSAGRPVVVGTLKPLSDKEARAHYEVVVAVHPQRKLVVTLDPALGWRQSSYAGFEKEWSGSGHTAIVTLPPTDEP